MRINEKDKSKVQGIINPILSKGPVLLSGIVSELRERGWRVCGHVCDHESLVLQLGYHVAKYEHGAGLAVWVGIGPFFQVTDFRGKVHEVRSFHTEGNGLYFNDSQES